MVGYTPAITRVLQTSAGVEHNAAKNPENSAERVWVANPSLYPVKFMTVRFAWSYVASSPRLTCSAGM
jgi:hypothetical protein